MDTMMPFSEKLSFLMQIAGAKNKEVAQALGVDTSLISLMRSGKRRLSRNPAQARAMAAFFAHRCPAPFQRQALSEMLGQVSISPDMPVENLASSLESWLLGEPLSLAGSFLAGMETPSAPWEAPAEPATPPMQIILDDSQTRFFFGHEGRREVLTQVMQACQRLEKPGTILAVVDDNLEWLLSDYVLSHRVQSGLLSLQEDGFTIQQIVPPMNYINRYAESLQFWLPVYASGKVKAYYYPRLRGNLYRHSIIVVPGCCVQYASAVGAGSTSDVTLFSTNPRLVDAFEKQFWDHASLCRPALVAHQDYQEALACIRSFLLSRGSTVQMVNALSIRSMPRALLERYMEESTLPVSRDTFQTYLNDLPNFEERLTQETFIDMCPLATAEEIRSGTVSVASSDRSCCGQPNYTPETYRLHLENILRLMDQYENYHFLPLAQREYPEFDLLVSEGGIALIARTTQSLMTLEIRRQTMVVAFQEHLLHRADALGYGTIRKEQVRMELRALIQQLS